MKKKRLKTVNKYYLITVTDMTHTRHFKVPKYIKKIVLSTVAVISVALLISNMVLYSQSNLLSFKNKHADKLEDKIVGVSQKNASLNTILESHARELSNISEALTRVEENTGVSGEISSTISERLLAISGYYEQRESSYNELGERVEEIEQTMGLESDKNGDSLASRIELASLNANQEKILHDNIPNGFPIRNLGVTSRFGTRTHPTTKQKKFHSGIDLRAKKPTNVYTTADGVVKQAKYNKLSGKHIVVQHNYGFETRYSHLSKMGVEVGDVVQKGDLIGKSGNTGRSTAPHLHYEVRYLEKALNPSNFLSWEFGSHEIFSKVREVKWHSLVNLINKQIKRPTLQLSQKVPASTEKFEPKKPST